METWLLQTEPHLSIQGKDLERLWRAGITALRVGKNKINVDLEQCPADHQLALVGVLITLGMSNGQIGTQTFRTTDGVKSQVTRLFEAVGATRRAEMARSFFATGAYSTDEALQSPLHLPPSQNKVIELASYGKTNKEIGDERDISHLTVKSHLYKATQQTGWETRELLILAALAGGDIVATAPEPEPWLDDSSVLTLLHTNDLPTTEPYQAVS
ncbi:MAG TPA: helix-turn-helix transcriptional regulator [Candidatus Saccharimonadales bacterium]|nr:helix-turn-helix transcriptional regulator [Candidatus Saccharimonadales bacterium]